MTISGSQITELHDGDVVELFDSNGTTVRGTLRRFGAVDSQGLSLGSSGIVLRRVDGCLAGQWADDWWSLTVISRAPRPLYVNHPRTEPAPGDVVRDADKPPTRWPFWVRQASRWAELRCENSCTWRGPHELPANLRLLVDGETGQVVP